MSDSLTLTPIGHLRAAKPLKFHALHQPDEAREESCVLELSPGCGYEQALSDLEGFSRIWLIWWFHRNESWKPMVIPPRGPKKKRGVFATRSPHRPNPMGMTPVRLLRVEGLRLILGPCDLIDGTPVFDIKPYIPSYDAFPDERSGWVGELDAALAAPPEFSVSLAPRAEAQCGWLAESWSVDFRTRMTELLERDPTSHRTRRIRKRADGLMEITCGAWRAFFEISDKAVTVLSISPAFPESHLRDLTLTRVPDREAQLAFLAKWPAVVALAIPSSTIRNPLMPHAEYADDLPLAEIPARLGALLDGERDFLANTANAASLLWHAIPGLNWCGFYFYRGGELVLGPFLGKPACVRIANNRGVCGAAVTRRATLLVPDVHAFPGHIACDASSAAELVVPLIDAGDRLLGVLDLDSPTKGRFTEEEARVLEKAMRVLLAGSDTPWFADGV